MKRPFGQAMRRNPVKDRLAKGDVCFGIWISWPSPELIEFCAGLGFEYIVIDSEHGPISPRNSSNLIRACEVAGAVPFVRVQENRPGFIHSFLDLGAMGIIVPHVKRAREGRAIARSIRFRPLGNRGVGASRAQYYGLWDSSKLSVYVEQSVEAILTLALIEDKEGIDNIVEILSVEGLDAIGIGITDLSVSVGIPGQFKHHDFHNMIAKAEDKIIASDKILDAVVSNYDGAQRAIDRGARMIGISAQSLLQSGGSDFLKLMHK